MKLNLLKAAAATGIVSLSVLAGSAAFASGDDAAKDAAELQAFVAASPEHAKMVTDVETKTGGKVTSAEVDDKNAKLIEFDVAMADGTEQEMILNTADGTMVAEVDQDGDESDGADEEGETDGENETSNN